MFSCNAKGSVFGPGPVCVVQNFYFSSLDIRRSAKGLPPVWQPGQYCNEESAKDTSATGVPHTGQGSPVRPCTRIPARLESLRDSAPRPWVAETASANTCRMVASNSSRSSRVRELAG